MLISKVVETAKQGGKAENRKRCILRLGSISDVRLWNKKDCYNAVVVRAVILRRVDALEGGTNKSRDHTAIKYPWEGNKYARKDWK